MHAVILFLTLLSTVTSFFSDKGMEKPTKEMICLRVFTDSSCETPLTDGDSSKKSWPMDKFKFITAFPAGVDECIQRDPEAWIKGTSKMANCNEDIKDFEGEHGLSEEQESSVCYRVFTDDSCETPVTDKKHPYKSFTEQKDAIPDLFPGTPFEKCFKRPGEEDYTKVTSSLDNCDEINPAYWQAKMSFWGPEEQKEEKVCLRVFSDVSCETPNTEDSQMFITFAIPKSKFSEVFAKGGEELEQCFENEEEDAYYKGTRDMRGCNKFNRNWSGPFDLANQAETGLGVVEKEEVCLRYYTDSSCKKVPTAENSGDNRWLSHSLEKAKFFSEYKGEELDSCIELDPETWIMATTDMANCNKKVEGFTGEHDEPEEEEKVCVWYYSDSSCTTTDKDGDIGRESILVAKSRFDSVADGQPLENCIESDMPGTWIKGTSNNLDGCNKMKKGWVGEHDAVPEEHTLGNEEIYCARYYSDSSCQKAVVDTDLKFGTKSFTVTKSQFETSGKPFNKCYKEGFGFLPTWVQVTTDLVECNVSNDQLTEEEVGAGLEASSPLRTKLLFCLAVILNIAALIAIYRTWCFHDKGSQLYVELV